MRVRAVAMKVELPELLLARMQILRMDASSDSLCRVGKIETEVKAYVSECPYTSRPTDRMSSNALLRSTTPCAR